MFTPGSKHQVQEFAQPFLLIASQVPRLGKHASSQSVLMQARKNRSRADVPGQCEEIMSAITGASS